MNQEFNSNVLDLFISTKEEPKRLEKNIIEVDPLGVKGDKFYNKDQERAILITSIDSYDLAKENGVELPIGYLGENILIDYNIYNLKEGDKVQIGEAILQITNNCTICKGLSKIREDVPELLKNHRGIFAKSLNNKSIKKGLNTFKITAI